MPISHEKKLCFDHDSADTQLVRALRRRGYLCLTSIDAGMERASDEDQLAFAAEGGWSIVTANQRDFARLHADWLGSGRSHPGVIVVAQRLVVSERIRGLSRLLAFVPALDDQIWFLATWAEES